MTNENGNTTFQNLWDAAKGSKREAYSNASLPQEVRQVSKKQPNSHKVIRKRRKNKAQNQQKEGDNKNQRGTSVVVQWLRICLPMQGTWVPALVQEDPTCRRATKPMCHNN